MDKPYNLIYKTRGLMMLPPCLLALVIAWLYPSASPVDWSLGLALFSAGVAVRIWAQTHLHYRLRVRKCLTTTGPYAHVRNPIYLANSAMLIGLVALSGALWLMPVMALWCAVVYSFVVRREEAHLTEKYGEPYRAFLSSTPRWVPALKSARADQPSTRPYLAASCAAELHCLLWLIPFAAVEWLARMH